MEEFTLFIHTHLFPSWGCTEWVCSFFWPLDALKDFESKTEPSGKLKPWVYKKYWVKNIAYNSNSMHNVEQCGDLPVKNDHQAHSDLATELQFAAVFYSSKVLDDKFMS